MGRFLRHNALSLLFFALFVGALIGQSFAGLADANEELVQHGRQTLSYGEYVLSSQFVVDVAENWQSEFLQFSLFIAGTVWLVQRSSPESKPPGSEGRGSDADQLVGAAARPDSPAWARVRGLRGWLYDNSLLLVMGVIFLGSWLAQSLAGHVAWNETNLQHGEAVQGWGAYLVSPEFWNRTLQNWQSEFLAVGAMIAFAIYLRQRGSSESKAVGDAHSSQSGYSG